jgi:Ser/Thr protein kinase RdoA (MazF antagonist)
VTVEIPLAGGRITPGVVRVGDTVRRPTSSNALFVHALLRHLEVVGFDAAPRFLGIDEQGREMLSFRKGTVPDNLRPDYDDDVLRGAARLLRAYHDAVAGCELAGGAEVVCHNDISPVNFVFEDDMPVSLIDFDAAGPGSRLRDLAYGLFLWLDLTDDGQPLDEQARRTQLFFEAYGLPVPAQLVDELLGRQRQTAVRAKARSADAAKWWRGQADWLERNRAEFEQALA